MNGRSWRWISMAVFCLVLSLLAWRSGDRARERPGLEQDVQVQPDRTSPERTEKLAAPLAAPSEREALQEELRGSPAANPKAPESRFLGGPRDMQCLLIDADTGAALADQELCIFRGLRNAGALWQLGEVLVRAKTDAQGGFTLSRTILFGARAFSLEVEGYAPFPFSRLRAKHDRPLEPIFAVRRAASLEIRVGEGSPLVGAIVAGVRHWPVLQLDTEKKRDTSAGWRAVVSTPERILFEDLPPGESIELSYFSGQKLHTSYGPPIVLSPGENAIIDWDLHPGVEVHGTAHDSLGAPWTKSEVVLFQEQVLEGVKKRLRTGKNRPTPNVSTATDESGRFTFEGIQPGQYWASVFKPGVVPDFRREAQLVTIPGDRTSYRLTLEFPRGLSLSGRVLSTAKLGRGVRVRASSASPELRASASVALDGESFKFDDLPKGQYELRAIPDPRDKSRVASLPVIADSGDTGIVLELRPGCRLSGQVVGGLGRFELYADPPVEYGVSFFDGPAWFEQESDGSFHIPTLDPGSIRLCATQAPNLIGVSQPVHLQLGESKAGVGIQLEVGATLRLENETLPHSLDGTLTFQGFEMPFYLREGQTSRFLVPAGRTVVRADDFRLEQPIELFFDLAPGEERTATLN